MDPQTFADFPTESADAPAQAFNEVPQGGSAGLDMGLRNVSTAHKFFNDPKAMLAAAQIFLKAGLPEGIKWLERGHQAAKENVFEAVGHLERGDTDAALKAFNQSGTFTKAKSIQKNADGTFTVDQEDAEPATFNLDQMRKSLLSPVEYLKAKDLERKQQHDKDYLDIQRKQVEQLGDYQRGSLKQKGEHDTLVANAAQDRLAAQERMFDLKKQFDAERTQWGNALREQALKTAPGMIYQDTVARLQKDGVDPAAAAAAAADHLLRSTSAIAERKDGKWDLTGRTPDGSISPIATFDTKQEAQKASLDFFKGGKAPAQQPSKADALANAMGPQEQKSAPSTSPRRLPPEITIDPNSKAGKMRARALERTQQDDATRAASRAEFEADASKLAPLELARKWTSRRGELGSPELRVLNAATSKL